MEGNDQIMRATLVKLQYLPYFQKIFQTNYITPVNLELKEEHFCCVKKSLNFKGYISVGQQNTKIL